MWYNKRHLITPGVITFKFVVPNVYFHCTNMKNKMTFKKKRGKFRYTKRFEVKNRCFQPFFLEQRQHGSDSQCCIMINLELFWSKV